MTKAQPADRADLRSVNFFRGGMRSVNFSRGGAGSAEFVLGGQPLAAFRTLKTRRQFLAVARTGKRSVRPGLILQVGDKHGEGQLPGEAGPRTGPRIGFTVSRKVGNAVARNRVKRRFRVLARDLLAEKADPARDYVLVGRRTAVTRPFALLQKDMEQALQDLKEKEQAQ